MNVNSTQATWGYKIGLFVAFMSLYLVFYVAPNMFHPWQATFLPLTAIDHAIPFIPWTFVVYTSDYTLFFFVIYSIKDKEHFNAFGRMMFATLFICGFFFWAYPTTYPRPAYFFHGESIFETLMKIVYSVDTPNNCFPSMHVALTSVASWGIRHRGKKFFYFYGTWSFLVFVSTLTTKQHYLADIIGGVAIAALAAYGEQYYSKVKSITYPNTAP